MKRVIYIASLDRDFSQWPPDWEGAIICIGTRLFLFKNGNRVEIENPLMLDVDEADELGMTWSESLVDQICNSRPAVNREAMLSQLFHGLYRTLAVHALTLQELTRRYPEYVIEVHASQPMQFLREWLGHPCLFVGPLKSKIPVWIDFGLALLRTVAKIQFAKCYSADLLTIVAWTQELKAIRRAILHDPSLELSACFVTTEGSPNMPAIGSFLTPRAWFRFMRNVTREWCAVHAFSKRVAGGTVEQTGVGYLLRQGLLRLELHRSLVIEMIDCVRPGVVTSFDDLTSALNFLLAEETRRRSLRFNWVQHGVILQARWRNRFRFPFDRFLLFGPKAVQVLAASGVPESACQPIGSIFFDRIRWVRRGNPEELWNQLRVPQTVAEHLLLFISQWGHVNNPDSVRRKNLQAVLETMKNRLDSFLIIKKHPQERDRLCEEVVAENLLSERVRIVSDIDLCDLLSVSRMVILQWSSAGYEALLMRVPIIVINHQDGEDRMNYVAEGVALRARNADELLMQIRFLESVGKGFPDENIRRNYLAREIYSEDGESARRYLEFVRDQLKET